MNPMWKSMAAGLLAAGLLSSCGAGSHPTSVSSDPGGSGSVEDQAEVSDQLARNPELVDEAVFDSADPVEMEGFAFGASLEASADSARRPPLRFWRHITDVRRTFEFSYRDTDSTGRPRIAVVTVNKILSGTFNIARPAPRDSSPVRGIVIQKRLRDLWTRKLVLHRVHIPEWDRPQWRIVGTSGVQITSREAATRIQSLRIQTSDRDTTITDPLALFRLRNVLRIADDDTIRLTVTTLRNDDVVVLQHPRLRRPFHNNGDNSYSIRLPVRFERGVHHLGVNALSHGTLFDNQAPYDSQAWIIPYVVRPTELADPGRDAADGVR